MPQRAKLSLAKLPISNHHGGGGNKRINTVRSLSQHHLNESDPSPSDFDDSTMLPLRLLAGGLAGDVANGGFPSSTYRVLHPPGTHSVGSLRCSPNESAVRMKRKTTKNSIDSSGNYYRITTKRNCSFESIEKENHHPSTSTATINNVDNAHAIVAATATSSAKKKIPSLSDNNLNVTDLSHS